MSDPGELNESQLDEHAALAQELLKTLARDTGRALGAHIRDPSDQFLRRSLVRTLFSSYEGALSYYKIFVFGALRALEAELRPETAAALREEAYRLDDKGRPQVAAMKLATIPNLRFVFRLVAQLVEEDLSLDCSGDGYRAFTIAQRVRDRLTHPKTTRSLDVTDEEIVALQDANGWWSTETGRLFDRFPKLLEMMKDNPA